MGVTFVFAVNPNLLVTGGLSSALLLTALGSGLLWGSGRGAPGAALLVVSLTVLALMVRVLRNARPELLRRDRGWERVEVEMERARRRDSAVTVARIPVEPTKVRAVGSAALDVEAAMRGGDAVWVEGESIFVMLADADRAEAQQGLDRAIGRLDVGLADEPTLASFPEDELTMGGLVDRLHRMRSPKVATLGRASRSRQAAHVHEVETEVSA